MDHILARYRLSQPDLPPEQLADAIALEQSLETDDRLLTDDIRASHRGQLRALDPIGDQDWLAEIAYPAHLASSQIGQLMQLLYGNASFYPRVRLESLTLPDSLRDALPGPLGGIPAIRNAIDVADRALLMTVLKPRGSTPDHFAQMAETFASAGGDILKDDQNLVESDLRLFEERIRKCAQAIDKASQKTGRRCLYLPHVAGSGGHLQRQLDRVVSAGLSGVVMCPWFMGLETAAAAARARGLLWLAHPAGAGVWTEPENCGISSELIFGLLPRLAGADLVIYPGSGGRISLRQGDERAIIRELTQPLGQHPASLPCSGGGKTLDQVATLADHLGSNLAIVVGSDLWLKGEQLGVSMQEAVSRLNQVSRNQGNL